MKVEFQYTGRKPPKIRKLWMGKLVDTIPGEEEGKDLYTLFTLGDWEERAIVAPLCRHMGQERCSCDRE